MRIVGHPPIKERRAIGGLRADVWTLAVPLPKLPG